MPTILSSWRASFDQRVGEDGGVGRRIRLGLGLGAGDDIELVDAVILVGRGFCGGITLALLGDDMDQHRALGIVADIAQDGQQVIEGMTVDRADMVETEFFEHRTAGDITTGMLDGAGDRAVDSLAEIGGQFLAELAEAHVAAAGGETRKISAHRARRRCNRHVVVVEDDDQAGIEGAGIVQRLIGHAGGHGAVADDGDHLAVGLRQFGGNRHAEAGGNRRGRVGSAEGIVFALGALGKAGEAVFLRSVRMRSRRPVRILCG